MISQTLGVQVECKRPDIFLIHQARGSCVLVLASTRSKEDQLRQLRTPMLVKEQGRCLTTVYSHGHSNSNSHNPSSGNGN